MTVTLDGGRCSLYLNASKVVPWDAYLDTVMPAVEYNPNPEIAEVPPQDADRFLRGSLVKMRNALEPVNRTGGTYYQGMATGEAEVAAALPDADADPETIGNARAELLKLGLPLGAEHEELAVDAIEKRTSAPLSSVRPRHLAGYFTSRAVEMQQHNGAIPQNDWSTEEWTKQGAMHAYCQAAVPLADGAGPCRIDYHEERFTRLLVEGESNINTIIEELSKRVPGEPGTGPRHRRPAGGLPVRRDRALRLRGGPLPRRPPAEGNRHYSSPAACMEGAAGLPGRPAVRGREAGPGGGRRFCSHRDARGSSPGSDA